MANDEQIVTSIGEFDRPATHRLPRFLPIFMQVDDSLRLSAIASIASLTVTCSGLFLNDLGQLTPFSFTVAPGSARAAALSTTQFGEGWIVHFALTVSGGTPRRGQLYVAVRVIRGLSALGFQTHTLFSGYLTTDFTPGFPDMPSEGPLTGQGMLRSVNQAAPAAGAEFTITVPTGARWQLQSLTYQLVTATAVATRDSTIIIDDGATTLLIMESGVTQTASLTKTYFYFPSATAVNDTTSNNIITSAPPMLLFQAWRIRSSTTALQAADAYSLIQVSVIEWLEL